MKILITAFEPFDNNDINYSYEVLKRIAQFDGLEKITLCVEYYNSFKNLQKKIIDYNPNIIILTGEARSYKSVGFEVIGVNDISNKPDNANFIPTSRYIIEGGADGIFSTLNFELFKKAFEEVGASYHRSLSAGSYVCNALLYQTLNYIKENNLNIKCGFIHIPKLKDDMDKVVGGINKYIEILLNP